MESDLSSSDTESQSSADYQDRPGRQIDGMHDILQTENQQPQEDVNYKKQSEKK